MEIGILGAINTLISQDIKTGSSGKGESGFSSLFANLLPKPVNTLNLQAASENTGDFSSEVLSGLLQLLQTNDILELENGMELLGKVAFQSNSDIINIIEEELNLSSEELVQLLSSFYTKLLSNKTEEKGPTLIDPNHTQQDKTDENQADIILSLIQSIASIQLKDMQLTPDKEFGQAMKVLKLFELLSAHQDSHSNQIKMREFMKSINEKLDILLNDSVRSNRDELLQKTFTNLVDELNGKSNVKSETNGDNVTKVLNKSEQVHQHGFIHFQQLSKPEQLTLFSQPANRPVSAEQLIEQFQSILSRSHFLKNGGTQRLFIKLNPEHLGALRVELIQKDSAIIARILTSTSTAKEMMESQLNGLKQAFHSQNIQVERVEISQQFTQQDRSFNREQQNGQERQEQHRQEQHEQQTNGEFTSSFEEALLNTEA
ncbi:flagellar hook-length control protein FliK [Bacillus sp. FJAT-49705]|uniref:Flagellar hook-length control protein FliK n=1 Tax=Cytobacillus citreus TaxID=2833586 RepID=A0ABS5NP98_9BACI|nr:flagellar hook-length control protein FliK [Cytobacillus citreus]